MSQVEEEYFDWLYDQVAGESARPDETYLRLLEHMYHKEFVWIVANDDNRAKDGKNLRLEFQEQGYGLNADTHWMGLGCSMLELFIGLSRRLEFNTETPARDWFWILISNCGLHRWHDRSRYNARRVDELLDNIIWRTYKPDGRGGLFPLDNAERDQRDVELWDQMSEYLLQGNN